MSAATCSGKSRAGGAKRGIIVGLGNPICSDDAVGWAVARALHARLADGDVELCELAAGGLDLVEHLAGYGYAVVVDAIQSPSGHVGDCYKLDWESGAGSHRLGGLHEVGLLEGLELARRLGLNMPKTVRVYVVEVADPYTFGTEMSAAVRDAVPRAVELILAAEFSGTDC